MSPLLSLPFRQTFHKELRKTSRESRIQWFVEKQAVPHRPVSSQHCSVEIRRRRNITPGNASLQGLSEGSPPWSNKPLLKDLPKARIPLSVRHQTTNGASGFIVLFRDYEFHKFDAGVATGCTGRSVHFFRDSPPTGSSRNRFGANGGSTNPYLSQRVYQRSVDKLPLSAGPVHARHKRSREMVRSASIRLHPRPFFPRSMTKRYLLTSWEPSANSPFLLAGYCAAV